MSNDVSGEPTALASDQGEQQRGTDRAAKRPGTEQRSLSASFWAVWLVAFAIVLGLTAAVVRFFSLPDRAHHDMAGMAGMGGSNAPAPGSALIRLRPTGQLHGLLGWDLVTKWQLDAIAVAFVVLLGAWYLTGVLRARRNGPWPFGRTLMFLLGLAVCVICTCGSIGVYDEALFSAHMIGHLGFVMLAPALLVAGRPVQLAMQASTPSGRERIERIVGGRVVAVLTAPPVALASYAVVIVGSHLTGLMDVIMSNSWAGQLEHLVYLVIGCQFFALVIGDAPIRWQLSTPAKWMLLALSMAVDTFVGVIILMSSDPFTMMSAPGLTVDPLSDTHTGGSIMWFGGDGIMAAVMIVIVMGWLRDPARQRLDNSSWIEQARRATFAEHTGATDVADDLDFDDEEGRLEAYNRWLSAINAEHPEQRPRHP